MSDDKRHDYLARKRPEDPAKVIPWHEKVAKGLGVPTIPQVPMPTPQRRDQEDRADRMPTQNKLGWWS